MTLTIELPPEAEAELRQRAQQEGMAASAYVLSIVERELGKFLPPANGATGAAVKVARPSDEALEIELDRLIEEGGSPRARAGLPPLSDVDISRETIYGERGL